MFWKHRESVSEATLQALNKSLAIIEFNLDGTVIQANANFLDLLDYRLDEIVGQHHRMFLDKEAAASPDYAVFWDKLRAGEYFADEFLRFGKNHKRVWLEATYNPFSTPAASRSRWSSSPPTSPRRRTRSAVS